MVDVDYHDGDGKHEAPLADVRAQLEQAATAGKLPGNLFHLTPRGARVVYVPAGPVTDREQYGRAITGACAESRGHLAHAPARVACVAFAGGGPASDYSPS